MLKAGNHVLTRGHRLGKSARSNDLAIRPTLAELHLRRERVVDDGITGDDRLSLAFHNGRFIGRNEAKLDDFMWLYWHYFSLRVACLSASPAVQPASCS